MFFYTQAARLAEEDKVKTPTLALAKVNNRDFSETLADKVEGVKGKDTCKYIGLRRGRDASRFTG